MDGWDRIGIIELTVKLWDSHITTIERGRIAAFINLGPICNFMVSLLLRSTLSKCCGVLHKIVFLSIRRGEKENQYDVYAHIAADSARDEDELDVQLPDGYCECPFAIITESQAPAEEYDNGRARFRLCILASPYYIDKFGSPFAELIPIDMLGTDEESKAFNVPDAIHP